MTRFAAVILYSLIFINPTFAVSQDEYFDEMITIKVGSHLKQEFFEVKSDFEGGIYIGLDQFLIFTELSEYTKLSIDSGTIRLFMAASLFTDKKARNIERELKTLSSIMIDGQLYLDKQGIAELLPVNAIRWLAEIYTLEILLNFNLPLDYRIAAQRRNRSVEKDKLSQLVLKKTDLFMRDHRKIIDFGMLRLRYDIDDVGNYFNKEQEGSKGNVELDYSSQLLYGDFNITHNIYGTQELKNISLKYPYIFKDKTVTIGDNRINGNNVLRSNENIRGISVSDNEYSITRSGRNVTIRGEAPTNALVEIYQNGKVSDFARVEGGDYEFTLEMRSQNDAFVIKIFDRNGVLLKQRSVNVLEGNDFLDKGKWDYNFFYGQNPEAENNAWDDLTYGISYGVTNNLTYSFDYYDTRNEDTLYKYTKHQAKYRFSNLVVPLLTKFSYYNSIPDNSKAYIGELRSEVFSHQLSYNYERYSDQLAEENNKESYQEAELSGNYGRSDYFFRFSSQKYKGKKENRFDTGLSYDINKAARLNVDLRKTVKRQSERRSNYTGKVGLDYNRGNFAYSLNAQFDQGRDANWKYAARLRKRLSPNTNYAYRVGINYDKKDNFSFEIAFEYKFNDSLKIDANYDSKRENRYKVRASYETVINIRQPFISNNAKSPDNGYLEGIIFIDQNANGEKEIEEKSLVGVEVGIGKNKVKTDSDGIFYLSDVSPYRSNQIFYDYSGILVDPTLRADSATTVKLIPASGKRVTVGLVPLSMIMGSIYLPEIDIRISKKFFSYAEIVVEKDGSYYASITPEYDGFFVLQDIKPGKYDLKINYLGSETIVLTKDTLTVNVLSGSTGEFYEGIDFNVITIKAKTTLGFIKDEDTARSSN
nr:hypothetical protein [uncultured Glaciecola sp.]